MKKILIVYYSWSNGNTERIAKELQYITGGDLARIDTVMPYKGRKNCGSFYDKWRLAGTCH